MQNHVHAGQAAGCPVLLLPIQSDFGRSFLSDFEQQRARTTSRVIDRGGVGDLRPTNAYDLRHDPADFGWCIELPFALTTLGGKVAH